MAGSSGADLTAAFAAIDAANADDPATIVVRGVQRPKEQAHAELAVEWVQRLVPDATDALLLAARAHHVRRWEIPRSAEDPGREGYLRWKNRLQRHHAEVVGRVLPAAGVDDATVARVQDLVRKRRIKTDREVQALEDALCLVFVETQLADLAAKLDEDLMVDVVAKSLAKMTPGGQAAALTFPLDGDLARIVGRAVERLATLPPDR